MNVVAEFPEKLEFLFEPHRYKVAWGGRVGTKSWSFARALVIQGVQRPLRVLCARETQKSIEESVHKLLSDQIGLLGFERRHHIAKTSIQGSNGTEFIFAGIRQATASNIKSYEGCDIVWVEEAQALTRRSWNILIPTIRKEGSEIWASFNPELESDDTYQRFVVNPPESAKVVRIGWEDNPWLPEVMRKEIKELKDRSPEEYAHIYGGGCKQVVEGAIYRQELITMDREERLTRVPYDPTRPVDTFWDLGYGDNTSIWFAQSFPFEFRIIDHLSDSLKSLQFYLQALQARGYVYGRHYLPHDAKAHELGTGRTIEEQVRVIYPDKVSVTPRLSVADGIAAVRAIFPKCYFDRDKTADGVSSLRHYRYEYNENLGTFKREPMHDWASHDADAFRTLAVAIQEAQRPEEKREHVSSSIPWGGTSSAGWMT